MTSLDVRKTFRVADVSESDDTDVYANIAIVIDAEGILQQFPPPAGQKPSDPIWLGNKPDPLIMLARRKVTSEPGWGSELEIVLPVNSSVRWRETTMSMNTQYRAQLYQFDPVDDPKYTYVSKPVAYTTGVDLPLPNDNDPLAPSLYPGHDYFWQAVGKADTLSMPYQRITYTWSFMILNKENKQLGYYKWDPYIKVVK